MPHRVVGRRRLPGWLVASLLLCFVLVTRGATAQAGRDAFNGPDAATTQQRIYQTRGSVLLLTVFAESTKVRLDRQSVVKLNNQSTHTVTWQTTTDTSEAAFGDLPFGRYDVEVSAVGYLTERKDVEVITAFNTVRLEIILHRDPTA